MSGEKNLTWYQFVTNLGTVVAKTKGDPWGFSAVGTRFEAYDACLAVTRPTVLFMSDTQEESPLEDINIYSQKDAEKLGFMDPHGGKLIEMAGDPITDYVAVRPNKDIRKTEITIHKQGVLWHYPLDNCEEIEGYVNKLMGRLPSINISDQMSNDLDKLHGQE